MDISETNASVAPAEAGYILEFEHGQNYDNVPTVTGSVYASVVVMNYTRNALEKHLLASKDSMAHSLVFGLHQPARSVREMQMSSTQES